VQHGFFRSAGGVVFSVDPPSSTGTVASGIDGAGYICGYFGDKEGSYHGFVRKSGGAYVSFDAANDTTLTIAMGTNSTGNIVGLFLDAQGIEHGFLRAPNGIVTSLDVPRALGTVATSISDAGQIVGGYTDTNEVQRG